MAVQKLAEGALAPSSMEGGNMVATNNVAMAFSGSTPITPMPEAPNLLDPNLPMPKIPAQQPVNPQAGHYGGTGLPPSPPLDNGETAGAGGFSTGVQGGGNQGHGNPGAGSSGPDRWQPTISSGGRAGGPQAPGS